MHKKGFTLIELLAVIVILGTIITIAIPRVMNLIDNARINAHINNERTLVRAARKYVSNNISMLPVNVGDTREITLTELQTNNFIETIRDPHNRNINCSGYVIVTRLGNNLFDYTPHLRCGNQNWIDNASEDGLLVHYNFDDFQEPTQNFVTISNMESYNVGHTGDVCGFSNNWESRFGVGNWSATIINVDNSPVPGLTKAQRITTTASGWGGWAAGNIGPTTGDIVYGVWIRLWHGQIEWGDLNTASRLYITTDTARLSNPAFNVVTPGEWVYVARRFSATGSGRHLYAAGPTRADILAVQIEGKAHPTPYVSGTRTAIINDHSTRNNDASLTLANTPRWLEEKGNGYYIFDGVANHIDTGRLFNFNKEDSFSVSFWIYSENHSHKESAAAGLVGKGHWYDNTWDIFLLNTNRIRFETSGNPVRNGIVVIDTGVLILQQWHHYVATYQNGIMRVYLNGNLIGTTTYIGTGNFNGNRNILIGSRHADLSRSFNGRLDDVRIYNRALSDDEIRRMYSIEEEKRR